MHPETALVLLFAVATAVAIATRRLKIPYTVALVIAGLGLGATHLVDGIHLTKDLLYSAFLPGLLFEAAYHLKFSDFRANAKAILALAVPGVLATIGATATLLVTSSGIADFAPGFGWPHALVFAALIAATDPIAVVALFKSLGAPERLSVLAEGESLVNDGTSIVLFSIVYAAATGGGTSVAAGVTEFVTVAGAGLAVGMVIGFAASRIMKRVDDPMIEITLTTIAAYGSFVLAEQWHFSGVIATVTAGMLCGSFAAPRVMSPTTRIAVESFWEYLAFALNSLVFLLIGLEVQVSSLLAEWRPIVVAFLAVNVGRAIVVFLASALLRPTREAIPWRWGIVLTWGGLRGALSMVLALAIPEEFANRRLLVTMTFGVVLLSIIVQGVTAGPLLRVLHLVGDHSRRARYDESRGELFAIHSALEAFDRLDHDDLVYADSVLAIRSEYEERARTIDAELTRMRTEDATLAREDLAVLRSRLTDAEKRAIRDAHDRGLIDGDSRDLLLRKIDERSARRT
jgi:CPA1 family monovalent cation:H+ antiporter